jgi:hypothetical protein
MKSARIIILFFFMIEFSVAQVYPPPSCVLYNNGVLTMCPPDSVPGYSGGLLGYNIYLDNDFIENLPAGSPEDSVSMTFNPLPLPGYRTFCATAVYQDWISDSVCETAFVRYGYELPFTEDWSSGSFETNNWTQEDDYWAISEESGNPAASVKFQGNSSLTNYFVPLTSYIFIADTNVESQAYLEIYVKLESVNNTGNEKLYAQYWDWTNQTWYGLYFINTSNAQGSFDWTRFYCRLDNVDKKLFRVRIVAEGLNSNDISSWYVDNIHVYRTCHAPDGLITEINEGSQVELWWEIPTGCGEYGNFIWWYSYMDSNNSIGTGDPAVFDVAARWMPEQLVDYAGHSINRIYFYPQESNATYTVRIWEGDSAALVYEQVAVAPVSGQWNYVALETTHPIDISQTLWIGYHIETNTGYPAGVDEGPAYNGYGNMMYWQGQWQTLLEINPDLDFNWLIEAYLGVGDPQYCGNRIYRKINNGEYNRIADIPMDIYYLDLEADPADLNCYMVTNVYGKNYDTCESFYSNESCLQPVNIGEETSDDSRLVVFPNPAEDQLFIEMPESMKEVQLLDMTGRVVYENEDIPNKLTIPVRGYSKGIYLLKVLVEDDLITRKVLIK